MGFAKSVLLPFQPLWEASHCETAGELAERLGRSRRQILRWKRDGVPARVADAVAVELGLVPSLIWPNRDDD